MKSLKEYIFNHLAQGKYFFTQQEVLSALNLSPNQFKFQAYRLSQKKLIQRLVCDFYMIIAPEYYYLGSLPPHWIIDPLMKYLGQEYYIGLLSAGSMHGSTEQQPMVFQVVTDRTTRMIWLERTTIEFHVSKTCASAVTTSLKTSVGYVKISTREQTMVDMVKYYPVAGFLSNAASVIQSLCEDSDPQKLAVVVEQEKTKSVLQRLGYILETVQCPQFAQVVEDEISKRSIEYTLLKPDFYIKSGEKSSRWKIVINDTLELE